MPALSSSQKCAGPLLEQALEPLILLHLWGLITGCLAGRLLWREGLERIAWTLNFLHWETLKADMQLRHTDGSSSTLVTEETAIITIADMSNHLLKCGLLTNDQVAFLACSR